MLLKASFFAALCVFAAAAPLPQDPSNLDPVIQTTDPSLDPVVQNTDPSLDPVIQNTDPSLDPVIQTTDPSLDPVGNTDAASQVETFGSPTPVYTSVTFPTEAPVYKPVKPISFDGWGGHESLKGFDDFYGVDNWDGYNFKQVFVKQEHELVCRKQEVHIVQQRLLVLQEMAKKIITETVCETESQVIIFEQWRGGLHGFGRDLIRFPGHHQVGYDQEIVKHFPKIINQHDFSLNLDDWKFTGKDLGKHTVIVKGHNWDDSRSPQLVHKAWNAARNAWFNLYGNGFNW